MAHTGKKVALGLIGGISGFLGFTKRFLDFLAVGNKAVDLLGHTDEIGFGKDGILILKEAHGLAQPGQEMLVSTVLLNQRQIGHREFMGTDLQHMIAQFSVVIELPVGCLDLFEKAVHLTGMRIPFAKKTTDLPFEELVKFHTKGIARPRRCS